MLNVIISFEFAMFFLNPSRYNKSIKQIWIKAFFA